MKSIGFFFTLMLIALPASAESIAPIAAIGFQDWDDTRYSGCPNPMLIQAETARVTARDSVWAPRVEGCMLFDYFGTGNSAEALDGISAHFNLPPTFARGLVLRVYAQRGDWTDLDPVHNADRSALRVYPGPFNGADQDCNWPDCGSSQDALPAGRHWEGWIERPIPAEWIVGGALDVTIRLWDARVDAVELVRGATTPTLSTTWGSLKVRYR